MVYNQELDKAFYEIQAMGALGAWRAEPFDGMQVSPGGGVTTISGFVADRAARHGPLARIRDFGPVLVSVRSAAGGRDEKVTG